jgi:hypothetical protein
MEVAAMTLHQAIDKNIERVRTEPWNKYAHALLPNFQGPWAKVVDPCGNFGTGKPYDHAMAVLMVKMDGFLSFDPNEDVWEEWKMPDDYVERFGHPPTYKETFR